MQRDSMHDYIVVGAGPAGLQMGYFLARAGRSYLVLEAADAPGAFFKVFPRHRTLLSINKIYSGSDDPETKLRHDWNSLLSDSEDMLFRNYSQEYMPHADALVRYLADFASHFDINIEYGCRVVGVSKDDFFRVRTAHGEVYACRRLVIATGIAEPCLPSVPGIEFAEMYPDVSIDPNDFRNQRVLIIGKGNSALETANNLIATTSLLHAVSPTPVKMAWQTHFVGHLRAINAPFMDTYQLKSQNAALDASVESIERVDGKLHVTFSFQHAENERKSLDYDRIIVCAGFRFDASIFDETCKPQLTINNRYPAQTSEWESVNVEGLYFAGASMAVRDYRKTTSAFIHGFRYNIRALHRVFESKYHDNAWPSRRVDRVPETLARAVLHRLNVDFAPLLTYQKFGRAMSRIVG